MVIPDPVKRRDGTKSTTDHVFIAIYFLFYGILLRFMRNGFFQWFSKCVQH